jgi:uncharacterized protein
VGLRFEWNSVKAGRNLKKHDVSFVEAATVFGDPLAGLIDDPDHSSRERRSIILGMSETSRLLVIVFTEENDTIRIITARQATKGERRQYKQDRSRRNSAGEMRKEYDFTRARPNRYAKKYSEGASLVVIDPELIRYFPNSASVNAALRALVSAFPQAKPEQASKVPNSPNPRWRRPPKKAGGSA